MASPMGQGCHRQFPLRPTTVPMGAGRTKANADSECGGEHDRSDDRPCWADRWHRPVSDDVDSCGVYGTIPSSIANSSARGARRYGHALRLLERAVPLRRASAPKRCNGACTVPPPAGVATARGSGSRRWDTSRPGRREWLGALVCRRGGGCMLGGSGGSGWCR